MRTRMRTTSFLLLSAAALAAGCAGQVPQDGSGTGNQPGSGGSVGPGTGGSGNLGSGGSVGPGTGGAAMGGSGVGSGGSTQSDCTPLPAISRRLWRLSLNQYSNATRDLLSLTAPVAVQSSTDGMSAYALFSDTSLTVSDGVLYSGFYQTTENVLVQIAPRIAAIANCGTDAPTACATRFATDFGRKAFRRPLDAAEVTNLMKVYTEGAKADFNTGISSMIEALLLSPSFLYRTELGPSTLTADASGKYPDTTLTPYEVASQLGFLFLNSIPDDKLMAAAADGSLGTSAGISTQVARLLTLAAVKANLTDVFVNWFSLGQLGDKAQKDTALLSALPATDQNQSVLVGDLLTSAQQFINDTLWGGTGAGKVTDLVTSQKVFVNKRLATLYGLPFTGATTATFMGTTWPAAQQRIGLLTQPAFLWSISAPAENSIVKRGQFIHDYVVCQDALPPPIDLSTPQAMAVIAMGDSEITKSDARTTPGVVCSGCHYQMDTYSRVLQNFGPIGNYRTADEKNRPIDPKVTFKIGPLAPMTVNNPSELAQALISSKLLAGCAVQKMSSYAIGTMVRTYNTCELRDLRTQFDQSNGNVASLFTQIATANFVRARAGGVQ